MIGTKIGLQKLFYVVLYHTVKFTLKANDLNLNSLGPEIMTINFVYSSGHNIIPRTIIGT